MALPDRAPESQQKEVTLSETEKIPIVERVIPKEVGPEVKDWLTKVETGAEIQLPQPVTDDNTGQAIVSPATPQQVAVTLPLTEEEISLGLGYKVIDSIRWLAEWCLRLVKITHGKIFYRWSSK